MALSGLGSVVGGVLKAVAGGEKAEGKKEVAKQDSGSNPLADLMNKKAAEQARLAKEITGLINN